MKQIILHYIHDPMCSWCWGFSDTLQQLITALPAGISVNRLLGGLAPDSNQPMSLAMQQQIQQSWHRIERTIPTKQFNFGFWHQNIPRRSTYPACRAVIAARQQGQHYDPLMTATIQQSYYQRALNPSDLFVLSQLAVEIGLNGSRFQHDIATAATETTLQSEISTARKLGVDSFPGLVLQQHRSHWPIPIDYNQIEPMLEIIEQLITDD